MTLLTGLTQDGKEVPVQVDQDGRLVAEGLPGPAGPAGAAGPAAFPAGTAPLPGLPVSGDPNTGLFSPGADQLAIATGGVERVRFLASGYLGIGTSVPGAKLDISGLGNLIRLGDGTNTFDVRFQGPHNWSTQLDTSADKFNVQRNGASLFTVDGAGSVGIGTSSPTATLTVKGNASIATTPVYADNAAARAGGLGVGDIYRKADGTLMIGF